MTNEFQCRVAAAILKFLKEHELEKTAKALLKETSKLDWELEDAESKEEQFDLMQLCSSYERRKNRRMRAPSAEDGMNDAKTANEQPTCTEEIQNVRKKCRLQRQQETPEAEALSISGDAEMAGGTHKKGHKHPSLDKTAADEQIKSVAPKESIPDDKQRKNDKGPRRFQRIDESQWTSTLPAELKDNSFWKKKNDNFAVKAAEQLGRVRGKDFRHEKTKKKKATWKGCGEIPMTVNSIQFASDSD